ncbi:hypothetical protein JCM10213_003116 [Rhodosporidiobolus nylandii]
MLPSPQLTRRAQSASQRAQADDPAPVTPPSTTAAPPPPLSTSSTAAAPFPHPRGGPSLREGGREDVVKAAEDERPQAIVVDEKDSLPQQCWICYEDASESPGRPLLHVCSCTLLAHSDCLLTWLSQQAATQAASPRCPVCATPIAIREESSRALELYRRARRKIDQLALVGAVGAAGASGWFVAAAYGAWVVKVFMGEGVARELLLRHEKGLPWRYWLNLPLIPFSLILSRTPLIDSLLPFLPLTLILSSHQHLPLFSLDPYGLDDLSFRFPPSPTLTVCLLPWLRLFYLRTRAQVFAKVLGRKKKYRGLAGVFEEAAEDEVAFASPSRAAGAGAAAEEPEGQQRELVELVATIEVEVEETEVPAAPPNPATAAAPATAQDPAALPTSARLRVGLGRLTSLVLGALLFPALSSLAGSALFWLATRRSGAKPFVLLRRALGVGAFVAASRGGSGAGGGGGAAGWLRGFLAPYSGLGGALSAGGKVVDPVWVRNTLGAGIVLLARDAVELTMGVLEQRRRASRRVVERPFVPGERSAAAAPAGVSGGRNRAGREARVHTML